MTPASQRYAVIDVDSHVTEPPDLWTSRISTKKWGDLVPHVKFSEYLQMDRWYVGDNRLPATKPRSPTLPEFRAVEHELRRHGSYPKAVWQLSYAELCTVETPWPDFREDELDAVLAEYATRVRRFGGLVRK